MKSIACIRLLPAATLALGLVFSGLGQAAGGNYSSSTNLKPILKLIEAGNYETAIDRLHDQLDQDPDNADIMSLLGFSYRKTRQFEDALTFYQWALRAEPGHRGANEYLGELYLQTRQLDKAQQQLEILDDLCTFGCAEYDKLKRAIDRYQQEMASKS